MLINIQRYFAGLLFAVMIFVCTFHRMADARRHHQNLGKSHSNHRYSNDYIRRNRFG
jgi:hypothetical protein